MSMEDNIKLIVEQVLKEIAVTEASGKGTSAGTSTGGSVSSAWTSAVAGTAASSPWNSGVGASVYDDADAEDLSTVDLQTQLLVPDPKNKDLYLDMKKSTSARIGVWRAGPRPLTQTLLRFRADHAVAQDSVMGEIAEEDAAKYNMVYVKSQCRDKDEYLTRPELGRVLDEDSIRKLEKECEKKPQVQILVADGLSSKAMEANIPDLYPAMLQGMQSMGIRVGTPIMAKYARVGLMDSIGEVIKPDVCVNLIGERPGLGTAESMSAYIVYNPRADVIESERTVLSNIHKGGTPAVEAGAHIAALIKKILDAKASGVNLER